MSCTFRAPVVATGALILLGLVLAAGRAAASDEVPQALRLRFAPRTAVTIEQRSNYSLRSQAGYQGLFSREVAVELAAAAGQVVDAGPEELHLEGMSLVYEIQRSAAVAGPRSLTASRSVTVVSDGTTVPSLLAVYPAGLVQPALRMPEEPVTAGMGWSDRVYVRFSPFEGSRNTEIPVGIAYTYAGMEDFEGRRVHRVDAVYGLRFPTGDEAYDPGELRGLAGGHEVTILFAEDGRMPVFLRDVFLEEFSAPDGRSMQRRGFSHTWFRERSGDGPPPEALAEEPGVTVEVEGPALRVRVSQLSFYPDEARLLPDDAARVGRLARRLAEEDATRYLVVGHTADVGNPEGQRELSEARARRIAAILADAGIPHDRIAYEGRGAREPIASNTDEEGRAANRRVEIFVFPR